VIERREELLAGIDCLLNPDLLIWKQLPQFRNDVFGRGFRLQLYRYIAQLDLNQIGIRHIGTDQDGINVFVFAQV
jgi:hypothetical protein